MFAGSINRSVHPVEFRASETMRYFGFLILAVAALAVFFTGFSFYEWGALGQHQLGIRKPPDYSFYYIARFAAALILSAIVVIGLYRLRATGSAIDSKRLPTRKRRGAWAMLIFAVACAGLFILNAGLFNRLSLEDHALEWISALLPLAASVGFAIAFVHIARAPERDGRRRVALAFTALLSLALFIIGMEEISWMQRVFDIATPSMFAENQQQEMNLHNMHSIVIGQAYKIVMFFALLLLPFLADTAPRNRLFDLFADFMPSRFVFAVSAPWVAFNYNEWNFIGSQLFVTIALAMLVCYLRAAWGRLDARELALFGASAVFILLAQPMFLLLGDRFLRMWDASEYVELFIAFGLSLYAAETIKKLIARYRDGRDDSDLRN
ncbi:MAG TPA: hypothetical protein VFS04_11550 [Alphaproteobacteria bacterium]|nr:hypothetical protein [Alphaproteobacteria bacterium]